MRTIERRQFIVSLSTALAGLSIARGQSQDTSTGALVVGQGKYQWRVVPGWGVLDKDTPVKDCHAMVQVKDGRIFLFTNETKNNVIIYDKAGKLLGKWGTEWPGAHGMTLAVEDGAEVFYLTDHDRHQFYKVSLDGKVLRTWDHPQASGKYPDNKTFKPTHVALAPDGGFFVLDGYGKNWVHRYDAKGEYVKSFGGDQPNDAHLKCAHGGWVDTRGEKPLLWITSRSESKLKRYTLDGELADVLELPGAQPNFIVPFGDLTVIPHLTGHTNEKGKPQNGFISVLDENSKVISNLAGPAPAYTDGKLARMGADTKLFTYPHGLLIDDEGSIYISQYNSGRTYPIKLQRLQA
ncbi:MAG: 6-bladed beta-propeller [Verrucomicrobiota bacterium]